MTDDPISVRCPGCGCRDLRIVSRRRYGRRHEIIVRACRFCGRKRQIVQRAEENVAGKAPGIAQDRRS